MAGLLDYLYSPSTYGGDGGLLSRLTPSVATIPQSAGFPQADQPPQAAPMQVGNYQMPRMGNADLYQPQQAMTPPNATPTQGQMAPQQAAAPQASFGDNLMAGLQGFSSAPGGLIPKLTGAIQGFSGGSAASNQTQQALIRRGLDPALAKTIVSDPSLLRAVLPHVLGQNGQTDDIKEYQFAKQEDPGLTFEKFMARKKSVSGEYGMQPIWGTGPDGKPAVLQLGKTGDAKQSVLPPGFSLARDPIKVEGPTGTTILDPQTRQPVQFIPKDVAGAAAQKERGEAQGQAQAALPGALADAERTKTNIDQLLNHEGLNSIVGSLDQYRPTWMLGEKGNDALARYKQLQGQAFLQAYNLLKGGGAITDIEGKKAEAAMARLDRAQSEDTFKEALKDFRDAIESGVAKLKAKAGGASNAPAAAAPTNLKSKYGLD